MKIGIVSAYYPPHLGGVELFTQNLAAQLAYDGHQVVVVTSLLEGTSARALTPEGVDVFRLPTRNLLGGRFPLLASERSFPGVAFELRHIPLDGVVVNTRFYPLSLFGAKLAREQGLTPIVIEHGSAHLAMGGSATSSIVERYEHAVTKRLLRYGPRFYGVSEQARSWLAHFGIEGAGVIHNAIDAQAFRAQSSGRDFKGELGIPHDSIVVAFTGRIVPEKGVWRLVEAADELGQKAAELAAAADEPQRPDAGRASAASPAFEFLIAGDGPDLAKLEDAASGRDNVHVLGRLSRPDIASLLECADVFCFPSAYPEGLPTSLLEAAACSCYIVSSHVGGAREVVPSADYGTVIEGNAAHDIARTLRDYAVNKEACDLKAAACAERVARTLTWESTARAVLDAIVGCKDLP